MTWRNRVEVSYSAVKHNLETVRRLAGARQVIAVVKADAYGLGLERCARIHVESGAALVAVASLGEADRVRRAVPRARILILGSPLPEERPAVVASGFEVCCSTPEEIQEYAHHAHTRPHPVHLFIDTGMGRAGCRPGDAQRLAAMVHELGHLHLAGVATHYPMAMDGTFTTAQEKTFEEALASLGPLPPTCLVHRANSEGLLTRPAGPCTAVRVGLLLSGVVPDGCPDPGLHPVMRWVSSINLVKRLPKGHGISYNRTAILERDSTIALVPVGYADGYPLTLSNRGQVLIQGHRCRVLGRVTMDYLIVDVTDLPRSPVPGDAVVLIGRDGSEEITVTEVAKATGTISYDILCGLRGRCEVVGVP